MSKAKSMKLDELAQSGRDTVEQREIKERDGVAKVDGRSLRKTGRDKQLIFRTTAAYRTKVENLAQAYGWTFNETLERGLDALEREMRATN